MIASYQAGPISAITTCWACLPYKGPQSCYKDDVNDSYLCKEHYEGRRRSMEAGKQRGARPIPERFVQERLL